MELSLTRKQYRRLLDMAYIGNWILNSTRGEDRFKDYDEVESILFSYAAQEGMPELAEEYYGAFLPSDAFADGGIHDAIMAHENNMLFEILAEDLAYRDMKKGVIDPGSQSEYVHRFQAYIYEFQAHGTDNIRIDSIE